MAEYLQFILLDEKGVERNVKMNKDDPNEVHIWCVKGNRGLLKNPYWKRCRISNGAGGYYVIAVRQKKYKLNRVCFFAHNQWWNIYDTSYDNAIDHIDRNRKNDNITNLRVATSSQNQENRIAKGYCYDKRDKLWFVYVTKHGKRHCKWCKTEEEAIAAREKLKAKYHTF